MSDSDNSGLAPAMAFLAIVLALVGIWEFFEKHGEQIMIGLGIVAGLAALVGLGYLWWMTEVCSDAYAIARETVSGIEIKRPGRRYFPKEDDVRIDLVPQSRPITRQGREMRVWFQPDRQNLESYARSFLFKSHPGKFVSEIGKSFGMDPTAPPSKESLDERFGARFGVVFITVETRPAMQMEPRRKEQVEVRPPTAFEKVLLEQMDAFTSIVKFDDWRQTTERQLESRFAQNPALKQTWDDWCEVTEQRLKAMF